MARADTSDQAPFAERRAPGRGDAFDAIVIAAPAAGEPSVCGLTLAERGRRVALRAGATRVTIVRPRDEIAIEPGDDRSLLVLDVTGQVVHSPLIAAVRDDGRGARTRVAVDPADPTRPVGAAWVTGDDRAAVLAAIRAGGAALTELLAAWLREGRADAAPHGDLARHPARTAAEQRAARRFLFRLIRKPQDTPLIRLVNRRVSYPFTRLLLPTPITPNMISIVVFLIGAFGCWMVAQPGYEAAVAGTSLVLFAGYLDGCDGEIARLRLEASKLGAWIDTIADEATTIMFIIAMGLHVHHDHPHPAVAAAVVLATFSAALTVYVVYYYLIVVARSGNSQDYPSEKGGKLEWLRLIVKRDFINLGAVVLAVAGLTTLMGATLGLGAVVTAGILFPQHIALRRSRRRRAAAGQPAALGDPS